MPRNNMCWSNPLGLTTNHFLSNFGSPLTPSKGNLAHKVLLSRPEHVSGIAPMTTYTSSVPTKCDAPSRSCLQRDLREARPAGA